ncbi:flavin reductase (DIM6/NTAB) family NADH-FMN oxidoreductase RutF [Phycicoccus badiiscoriae]|uniref:Flavin reductase (DIM6/NTAB) family NADH-FMN oxidoreductase RutF n=1 Tax=Pedococcus badiiscoriae TaxID=642776 RepID=A0A852WKV5_9MICO|nr:flavin reductase family protein [Pedococcus badiiscoriae]NYG07384.1 flavin reductase (DIM6/NTAB) family NADH-FMN oxidoreductase RutF [Pedococcus badiiscoriae]
MEVERVFGENNLGHGIQSYDRSVTQHPIAAGWVDEPDQNPSDAPTQDGAGYVDAATVALRFASITLANESEVPATSEEPAKVTPRLIRDVMGSMATGVCVVTTKWDGDDVAMTANSVTSVSLDPPLVLVCIAKGARFREAIVSSNVWGLSILDAGAYEISSHFARPGRERAGQMSAMAYRHGAVTGVALLEASVGVVECETHEIHDGGDHLIIVGRVVNASRSGEGSHPLLFHRGRYCWFV